MVIVLLVMVVLGQLLILPVFGQGIFVSHDLLSHWNWSRHFSAQFWEGDLYPRWLAEMNGGRGSPVFFFYGPVAYWATALLSLPAGDGSGWLALGLSFGLAAGLSGFTAFLWLRDLGGDNAGFWTALIYLTFPYHIPVEVFFRFSLAEMWALAWIPLVFWSCRRALLGQAGITWLAGSFALLILTHPPATLLTCLILPAYGILHAAWLPGGWRLVGRLCFGLLGGLGLAAVYLIPLLETWQWVSLGWLREGIGDFSRNFLWMVSPPGETGFGASHPFRHYLEQITLYLAVLVAACGLLMISAKRREQREGVFWLGVALLSLFMMTPFSAGVWEYLPILQILQFPWRFQVLLLVAGAALLAPAVGMAVSRSFLTKGVLATLLLCNGMMVLDAAVPRFLGDPRERDLAIIAGSLAVSEGAPEYLPRWVPRETMDQVADRTLDRKRADFALQAGEGRIEILRETRGRTLLGIQSETPLLVEVKSFYFPLWKLTSDKEPRARISGPSDAGFLLLDLPAGDYRAELSFSRSPGEKIGLGITLSALLLLFLWDRRRLR